MQELFKAIASHFERQPYSDLYTALSGRFYCDEAPQGTGLPYGAYSLVVDTPYYNFIETFERIVVAFDFFAGTEAGIQALYNNCKADFDDVEMTVAGYQLIRFQRSAVLKHKVDNYKRLTVQYTVDLEKES